jgi:hypothetical protein
MKLIDFLNEFGSDAVVSTNGYDCNIVDYRIALQGTDEAELDVYVQGEARGVYSVCAYDTDGYLMSTELFSVFADEDAYEEYMSR